MDANDHYNTGLRLMQTIEAKIQAHARLSEEEQRKLRDAEESFKQALEVAPDHGRAYCMLGMLYERTGRIDEAIPNLEKARELPKGSRDWNIASGVLVNAYFSQANAVASLPVLLELTEYAPTDVDAWYKLGLSFTVLETNDHSKALAAFEKALELNPNHQPCTDQLAILKRKIAAQGPPPNVNDIQVKMALYQHETEVLSTKMQAGEMTPAEFSEAIQALSVRFF